MLAILSSTILQSFQQFAGACGSTKSFFSFPTWYQYIPTANDAAGNCAVKFVIPDSIPAVALAIVDILVRVATFVAIGYVIYGGIRYTTSQGEPQALASARETIINALAGLVLAALAAAILSFIGNKIGG